MVFAETTFRPLKYPMKGIIVEKTANATIKIQIESDTRKELFDLAVGIILN